MSGSELDVTRHVGLDRLKILTDEILNSLPSLYYMVAPDGRIAKWNDRSVEVTGYSDADHQSLNVRQLIAPDDVDRVMEEMRRVFDDGQATVEAHLLTKDGRRIPYLFSGKRIAVDGQDYLSGLGLDLSQQKDLERQLERLAHIDPLTDLPNRRHFMRQLEREAAWFERGGPPFALLMVDVDHFKLINDTYGHPAGDEALKAVASMLASTVRDADSVARIGGEEFAVLLHEATDGDALTTAERVREAAAGLAVRLADGQVLRLTLSIGVAWREPADDATDDVLRRADAALYDAKRAGRNRVRGRPREPSSPWSEAPASEEPPEKTTGPRVSPGA